MAFGKMTGTKSQSFYLSKQEKVGSSETTTNAVRCSLSYITAAIPFGAIRRGRLKREK